MQDSQINPVPAPFAPTPLFSAPALPLGAAALEALPAYTPALVDDTSDPAVRLIDALAAFEIRDGDTPAAALVQVSNMGGNRYGTLLLSEARIDEILTALAPVLADAAFAPSGGAR